MPGGDCGADGSLIATGFDVALTHIRLSTLDFSEVELGQVRRARLLLAQVSASALEGEAYALLHRASEAANLRRLVGLLGTGRIEVRSSPLGGWAPDFTVFDDQGGPFAVLIGPHRFDRGALYDGPELASLHGREAAARVALRFAEIWERAHDISPAVLGLLARADRPILAG